MRTTILATSKSILTSAARLGVLMGTVILGTSQSWSQPYSIWDDATVPGLPSAGDPNAVELGLKFETLTNGYVTGIRFYKGAGNAEPHVGNLWTSAGTLLATVTFENETDSGWQTQVLPAPLPISTGITYVVSYFAPNGMYAADLDYFAASGFDSYPLRALADGEDGPNGLYRYSGTSAFPTNTFRAANYWVDLVMVPEDNGCANDTNSPTIIAPADVILQCAECDTDPSITGTASATDDCNVTVTYSDSVSGTCPQVLTRTWMATDDAGNSASDTQIITCIPSSVVTDSSGCIFDRDPNTPVQDFRLTFIQDPQNWPCFRIASSNPGQFRYSAFYTGTPGESINLDLTLPYPFVTQGANPIQAYDWVTVMGGPDQQCLVPGEGFFVSSQQVMLADYDEEVGGEMVTNPTTTIPVTLTVPDSGVVYLSVHLDYGLKKMSGFSLGLDDDAVDCDTRALLISNHGTYGFSIGGDQAGTSTIENNNRWKKIRGVAGLVLYEGSEDPVPDTIVGLERTSDNEIVGVTVTDEDGFYLIPSKHKGKDAPYALSIVTPDGYEDTVGVDLKRNKYLWVDFLAPAGP